MGKARMSEKLRGTTYIMKDASTKQKHWIICPLIGRGCLLVKNMYSAGGIIWIFCF